MPKKIGIMTLYYKTYNYGAQLQCYALQRTLSKMGYDAELIRFKWNRVELDRFYRYAGSANYDKFEKFSKSIPHSKGIYTPENIHECAEDYDIFICGSDQIWGVNDSMPIYVLPHITLSFVPDSKIKIAYAASMGGSAVSDRIKDAIALSVQRLDAISVRETSAAEFVSEMAGKPVYAVLDPTMLLTSEEWEEVAVKPNTDCEYIFVYNIGGNAYLDETAKKLSSELNCEIRTISYSPTDSTGPAEFIGLIKYAKYVLTNSFHGTIFSILYKKQFLTFEIDNRNDNLSKNIRIINLLESIELSSRFVDFKAIANYENELEYWNVNQRVNRLRKASMQFLTQSLSEKCSANIRMHDAMCETSNCTNSLRDYVQAISNVYNGDVFLYERKLVEKEFEYEKLCRDFDNEIRRNEIYCKLMKFNSFGLSLDYDPLLTDKVVIYGAGKIGRLASECFDNNMLCFADSSGSIDSYFGYKVFKLNDSGLRDIVEKQERVAFLITPVWDFDILEMKIIDLFPNANVISIEKMVEKIWL